MATSPPQPTSQPPSPSMSSAPSAAAVAPTHFELAQLFRLPSPNPNPNPTPLPAIYPAVGQPPPPINPAGLFSYPPATIPYHLYQHRPAIPSYPPQNPNTNPNPGARLMQLLGNSCPATPLESAVSPSPGLALEASAPQLVPPARLSSTSSSKLPRGRYLGNCERAVHDVDLRLHGETQPPQLEVTPITKYTSDPGLVLGRQIAVNKSYIVYGLKMGNIRVLNINTAVRSLLRGHTQRVTDMAFFAEDVHLLASSSVDGRVFVWKVEEGPDKENKPQIAGKVTTAVQIGDGNSYHPRICWHSHKQEILFLGIGTFVLRLDTTKVGRGRNFSADEPIKCSLDKLIDGLQIVGNHDGDVTDLSISQWMTTRLASASKDGTVKIWDERRGVPLTVMRPNGGHPVSSVAFLTSPNRPDHINIITAGPLNRELKFWAFASEEGWLLSDDSESWQCTQTLELISSSQSIPDEAFFNQVTVVPSASIILLSNAKKNTIYAVHVEFGVDPMSTRMDYIADFAVTMPILSLTGTFEVQRDGEQVVQVYCVQTMAIQQYALDLVLCLPPIAESCKAAKEADVSRFEPHSDARAAEQLAEDSISHGSGGTSLPKLRAEMADEDKTLACTTTPTSSEVFVSSAISTSLSEFKPPAQPLIYTEGDASVHVASGLSSEVDQSGVPTLVSASSEEKAHICSDTEKSMFSNLANWRVENAGQVVTESSRKNDKSGNGEYSSGQSGISMAQSSRTVLKTGGNTTHLVTPSEIMSGAFSSAEPNLSKQSERMEDVRILEKDPNKFAKGSELEAKHVDQGKQKKRMESDGAVDAYCVSETKEIDPSCLHYIVDQASGQDSNNASGQHSSNMGDSQPVLVSLKSGSLQQEKIQSQVKDLWNKVTDHSDATQLPSVSKESENSQFLHDSCATSTSRSVLNCADSLNEPGTSSAPSNDLSQPSILNIQGALQKLEAMQEDLQKQFSLLVTGPIAKEGRRIETSLGRTMEKLIKANSEALWARMQEDNAKHEKTDRERSQQLTCLITNSISKDMPGVLERTLKKEVSALVPNVARALTPVIEKSILSAVVDSLQKVVGDKMVNQLDKSVSSKIETTVARQIQAQFSTSGKQALQDVLRTCLESSIIPAFEQSCRTMFEQIDTTFQKGMSDHSTGIQQQVEAAHTPLAMTLRDTISSASSITQGLTGELLDGQRKLLAIFVAGNTSGLNPTLQTVNAPIVVPSEIVEAPIDPTREIGRFLSDHKFNEAFTMALHKSDVSIVSWLCSQVDLHALCQMAPLPLNQGVLLALLQQLACDIHVDTSRKVSWMTDVAMAINPSDPMIAVHIRPIFEQVYAILAHHRTLPTTSPSDGNTIRLIMHVINSVLLSYK